MSFQRQQINTLHQRLGEAPRFLIVVNGPRQVGKTTLVRQALATASAASFVSADQPNVSADPFAERSGFSADTATHFRPGPAASVEWLVEQWQAARARASRAPDGDRQVLAIDEIQKIPRWSEVVKGLWDEDRARQLPLHIVLLGSSPWLMQRGLSESLAGRYELLPMTHWSYGEMLEAFDFSLDEYVYFGGYPGAASLIREQRRWRDYVQRSLIYPNIEKDILQMTRVDKPALLKTLFELGCGAYSGQIISYTKLQGQLQDAGNTTTLAHYLDLLGHAGLLTGLPKFAGEKHRQRASSPKLNALNTGLMSALSGYSFEQARADRSFWGRLVESAVGAHLYNTAGDCELFYWRESPDEVDFILANRHALAAIEVKSGPSFSAPKGLARFCENYAAAKPLIVGLGGISLAEFLLQPAEYWLT